MNTKFYELYVTNDMDDLADELERFRRECWEQSREEYPRAHWKFTLAPQGYGWYYLTCEVELLPNPAH